MVLKSKNSYKSLSYIALAICLCAMGCQTAQPKRQMGVASPYKGMVTLVVAPVMNFSGANDIDMMRITDLLFSELQQIEGVTVIPVNRTLAAMAADHLDTIETPEQAVSLAGRLGADATIVTAITEYNPFYPPTVGLAMQIYGFNATGRRVLIDPVSLERQAAPIRITSDLDRSRLPKNQISRIYNGTDKKTVSDVKRFAKQRGTGISPFGWDLYMRSQEKYLRFVFNMAITEMFQKEAIRVSETEATGHQGV